MKILNIKERTTTLKKINIMPTSPRTIREVKGGVVPLDSPYQGVRRGTFLLNRVRVLRNNNDAQQAQGRAKADQMRKYTEHLAE